MNQKSFHLSGIGGVGMRALAQALLDAGHRVSGSDRLLDAGDAQEAFACLRGQGVSLFPQDGSGIRPELAGLIVSSAIEADNPEWLRARELEIPVIHRARALADLAEGRQLVAVAGTCGKSTVTALLGWLLEGAGFDPMVVNGAAVASWDAGGTRIGAVRKGPAVGGWMVAEVDESDKSLTVFTPAHAIITNASADHFGLDESLSLFDAFRAKVGGIVIDGIRDAARPEAMATTGWDGFFTYEGIRYRVPMPGEHNIWNAWNAVRMARALGADAAALQQALATFGGVERRLQRVGRCADATVVDDYAHNPEKLAAAWRTLAAAFPAGVAGVWRPHGFAPLRKMLDGLTEMFTAVLRPCDRLFVLPVYDAGGTADRSVNSPALVAALHARGCGQVEVVDSPAAAEAALRACAAPGRVLATFGARDPELPRIAARLASTATPHGPA